MKRFIVTTTINPPTEAVKLFDEMPGWHLIVIGDQKTPNNYKLKNGTYVSPAEQELFAKTLSAAIGWNCIQRRNLGFAMAHHLGAELVATVDDDNIPLEGWGQDLLVGKDIEMDEYLVDDIAFDPISVTNYPHLWHRGFPFQLLNDRKSNQKIRSTIKPMIQADFWNGDPDIDAVCRMEHRPTCAFGPEPFPFCSNQFSPFNSQNTFIHADVLAEYFMFPFIGRMDDIWASYYVQALGHRVAYSQASVTQDRNIHDLTEDMKKEFLGYEKNLALIKALRLDPQSIFSFLPERSQKAFEEYRKLFQ